MDYKSGDQKPSTRIKARGCVNCMRHKLNTIDYMSNLPNGLTVNDFVEVQFKNTRKGYYLNSLRLPLSKGDMVAVEASPGHDIGTITLTGVLVQLQMKKHGYKAPNGQPQRIYRVAKPVDLEKYYESKALEESTMIQARQIAKELDLEMKIGDVEYQGDGQKAIFYYIADSRVDFRQLIKRLSSAFHVRVEMRQIGARQEAGRIGGIGPCGRQLCCSSWMTNFVSVGTHAARLQDLSMNPQKLAGQCAKLKCCLNYEVDVYHEAQKKLPTSDILISTQNGLYKQVKTDALAGQLTYLNKSANNAIPEMVTISAQRAFHLIQANKGGITPFSLTSDVEPERKLKMEKDILDPDALTRFDKPSLKKKRKNRPQNGATKSKQNNTSAQDKSATPELNKVAGVPTPKPQRHNKKFHNNKLPQNNNNGTLPSDSSTKN